MAFKKIITLKGLEPYFEKYKHFSRRKLSFIYNRDFSYKVKSRRYHLDEMDFAILFMIWITLTKAPYFSPHGVPFLELLKIIRLSKRNLYERLRKLEALNLIIRNDYPLTSLGYKTKGMKFFYNLNTKKENFVKSPFSKENRDDPYDLISFLFNEPTSKVKERLCIQHLLSIYGSDY